MLAFLAGEATSARAIISSLAADVFVYFNDLAPVLRAVAQRAGSRRRVRVHASRPTTETACMLRETLRYAHGEAHVQAALAAAGLKPVSLDFASTRTEKGVPVPGLIVVAVEPAESAWNLATRYSSTPRRNCRISSRAGSPAAAGSRARISSSCWQKRKAGRSALLIAPTGGGKTLAGFLPTLVELSERGLRAAQFDVDRPSSGALARAAHALHLAPEGARRRHRAQPRNPVREMGLPMRLETRTGDTPASKRQRQRRDPPDILLTTPEQLALLLATADAPYLFGTLRRVVLDELHSLVTSKRGDLLSLGLARLFALAPQLATIGLSATVAEPDELCRFLVPQPLHGQARADLVTAEAGAQPIVTMLDTDRTFALGRALGPSRARGNLCAHQDA